MTITDEMINGFFSFLGLVAVLCFAVKVMADLEEIVELLREIAKK